MNWTSLYLFSIIVIFLVILIGNISQRKTNQLFQNYSNDHSNNNISGLNLISTLFSKTEIDQVSITIINNKKTNKYLPRHHVIKLSSYTATSTTYLSLGICAHEVGHANQHKNKNFAYLLKSVFSSATSIIEKIYIPCLLIFAIFINTALKNVIFYASLVLTILYFISVVFDFLINIFELNNSRQVSSLLNSTELFNSYELTKLSNVLYALSLNYIAEVAKNSLAFINLLLFGSLFSNFTE